MVDFFADARDLSVRSQLAQDVLVVVGLAEGARLVDRLGGVTHDVFEAQRTQLIPLVLGRLERYAV